MAEETNSQIVKAESKAFGYNYASLADIAKAGLKIPKMKTVLVEGAEYVFYQDGDSWEQGARVVIPEMKGSNSAQAYGAAVTYARRYTAQLALGLACDDDSKVETKAPSSQFAKINRSAEAGQSVQKPWVKTAHPTPKQIAKIKELLMAKGYTEEQAAEWAKKPQSMAEASRAIDKLMREAQEGA